MPAASIRLSLRETGSAARAVGGHREAVEIRAAAREPSVQ
jgi:hypothetical protein